MGWMWMWMWMCEWIHMECANGSIDTQILRTHPLNKDQHIPVHQTIPIQSHQHHITSYLILNPPRSSHHNFRISCHHISIRLISHITSHMIDHKRGSSCSSLHVSLSVLWLSPLTPSPTTIYLSIYLSIYPSLYSSLEEKYRLPILHTFLAFLTQVLLYCNKIIIVLLINLPSIISKPKTQNPQPIHPSIHPRPPLSTSRPTKQAR